MLELTAPRKNKINLSDYNSELDIGNRILMSDFSPFDLEVLEELLYSPLKVSVKKLARSLQTTETLLLPILEKIGKGGFLSVQEDVLSVDKETRKYFEFEIQRFNPEFRPDIEFLQGLLRKVPIHVLPSWYSIPRSSNNIFESLIEKHFLTPAMFQRYLSELHVIDPRIRGIIHDVMTSPNLRVSSSDLIARYNLNRRDFEQIMLLLEFHFACCVRYIKEDDHWHEIVTPFQEWNDYLSFLKQTEAPAIPNPRAVQRRTERDFGFVEELSALLQKIKKKPSSETGPLADKLCLVKLAERTAGRLQPSEFASEWLDLSLENRALYLYRNPHNKILSHPLCSHHSMEKTVREAEKSIKRVLHGEWIFFDDFIKGVYLPLNDIPISLKKSGKHWKYTLPQYSEEEKKIVRSTVMEWLYESGMTAAGQLQGRDCFCVTPFGRFIFDD